MKHTQIHVDEKTDGWIIGAANLKAHFKGVALHTLKRWVEYGFPLYTLPNGDYAVIAVEADEWLRCFTEKTSPFQLKPLTGAALAAHNGEIIGAMKTNAASHQAAVERERQRVLREAEAMHKDGHIDYFGNLPHDTFTESVPL